MKLKKTILTTIDRNTLKSVVETLEMEDLDRRSVEDMRTKLSRRRRATSEIQLTHLHEKQVKSVCEQIGVSPKGRRKVLVERLLDQTGPSALRSARQFSSCSTKTAKPNRSKPQKESLPMGDKKNTDNYNEQESPPVHLPDPPLGMMRVTRTELVWPGKYSEDGTLKEVPRVNLPFQVIETVNESRATREAITQKGGIQRRLFDIYEGKEGESFEERWKNKLIWGDILELIRRR